MPKTKANFKSTENGESSGASAFPQRQKRVQDTVSQSRPTKRRKHSTSSDDSQKFVNVNHNISIDDGGSKIADHTKTRSATKEPSKHFRFGSEDPVEKPTIITEPEVVELVQDDDSDSDDEAPENVSASTALRDAKGAAAAAVEAADKQRLRLKEGRQAKDALRKAQTKKSSKKKPTKPVETQATSESDEDEPELLPTELLEHEFDRAPTPPPQSDIRSTTSNAKPKKVLLDQLPQETQAGPVKVRVLEMTNRFLAPRAVQRSKDRREHWLQGRSSGRGVNAFVRQPMNARFV